MSVLTVYLLFALTTAIAALYELFVPILREYALIEPNDVLVENPYLTYTVCFLSVLVFAPLFFPIVLIPSMSAWFKKSILDTWTLQAPKI